MLLALFHNLNGLIVPNLLVALGILRSRLHILLRVPERGAILVKEPLHLLLRAVRVHLDPLLPLRLETLLLVTPGEIRVGVEIECDERVLELVEHLGHAVGLLFEDGCDVVCRVVLPERDHVFVLEQALDHLPVFELFAAGVDLGELLLEFLCVDDVVVCSPGLDIRLE